MRLLPGYEGFEYDYLGSRPSRDQAKARALDVWRATQSGPGRIVGRELLFEPSGNLMENETHGRCISRSDTGIDADGPKGQVFHRRHAAHPGVVVAARIRKVGRRDPGAGRERTFRLPAWFRPSLCPSGNSEHDNKKLVEASAPTSSVLPGPAHREPAMVRTSELQPRADLPEPGHPGLRDSAPHTQGPAEVRTGRIAGAAALALDAVDVEDVVQVQ
jgi:hypothetical protein